MSRSGRIPINIPENTQVRVEKGIIFAKGKLGELSFEFNNDAKVELKDNNVVVKKAVILNIIVKCGELLGPELII